MKMEKLHSGKFRNGATFIYLSEALFVTLLKYKMKQKQIKKSNYAFFNYLLMYKTLHSGNDCIFKLCLKLIYPNSFDPLSLYSAFLDNCFRKSLRTLTAKNDFPVNVEKQNCAGI